MKAVDLKPVLPIDKLLKHFLEILMCPKCKNSYRWEMMDCPSCEGADRDYSPKDLEEYNTQGELDGSEE